MLLGDATSIVTDIGALYTSIYPIVWGAVAVGIGVAVVKMLKKR